MNHTELPTRDELDVLVDTDPIRLLSTAIGLRAEVEQHRAQRDLLIALHECSELAPGAYCCMHCTPEYCDNVSDAVAWPCRSLDAVGVTSCTGGPDEHGSHEAGTR